GALAGARGAQGRKGRARDDAGREQAVPDRPASGSVDHLSSPCCFGRDRRISAMATRSLGETGAQWKYRMASEFIAAGYSLDGGRSIESVGLLVCVPPRGFLAHGECRLSHPLRAHRLAHEGANRGRMRPPADGHEVDLSPELRLDQWPRDDTAMVHRIFRHEPEPQPCGDHGQDPVVALAAVHHLAGGPAFAEDRVAVELAIRPVEISLAVKILDANGIARGERMAGVDHDHELLAEQRHVMQALVVLPPGHTIDPDLEIARGQPFLERRRARVEQLQL